MKRRIGAVLAASVLVSTVVGVAPAAAAGTGEIHGRVTRAASGSGLAGASVTVFDPATREVAASTVTGAGGKYGVAGLPAGRAYQVCFAPPGQFAASLAAQCWQDVPWAGNGTPPDNATFVQVRSGRSRSGISAALDPIGSLSGFVHLLDSPALSDQLLVRVFSLSTGAEAAELYADGVGSFAVPGLAPGDYAMCVDTFQLQPFEVATTQYPYGIEAGCVGAPVWTYADRVALRVPAGATALTVRAGRETTTALTLEPAAALGGFLRSLGGEYVSNVVVHTWDSAGNALPLPPAQSLSYAVPSLDPGASYRVCFDASAATGDDGPDGYKSQCWVRKAWAPGQPVNPAALPATTGAAGTQRAGVDSKLAPV